MGMRGESMGRYLLRKVSECAKEQQQVFLNSSPHYFWRQNLSVRLELTYLARLASQQALRIFLSPTSLVLEFQTHTTMPGFYTDAGDPNTGFCAGTANTLLAEPSSQPKAFLLH